LRTIDDGGSISLSTLNFSSSRARRERAKELGERARAKIDFVLLLEEVCQRVLKAGRQGAPAVIGLGKEQVRHFSRHKALATMLIYRDEHDRAATHRTLADVVARTVLESKGGA
jgi:hypothetical protein